MMNKFLARFQDEPTLVAPENRAWFESCIHELATKYETIEAKLIETKAASNDNADDFWSDDWDWVRPYVVVDGILQIPVKGVLLHDFPYQLWSWATGYEYIWRCFKRGMEDGNVSGIAFIVDSPGGMVAGCFEAADRMYEMRGKKPVRGFASESAYSAAYAIISVADEIWVTRTGGVGSIGVVCSHVDVSAAMDRAGYKVTFIYAGAHKVDGNAYEALPKAVKERIQARIDFLYGIFTSSVARNRNMDEQAVRDTEALTYGAADSIDIGLADKIGSLDDALADFSASLTLDEGDETMADFTQAQHDEALAAAVAKATADATAAATTAAATAQKDRINAIIGCDAAKTRPAAALAAALDTDMTAEQAEKFLAKLPPEKTEAKDEANDAEANEGAGVGKNRFDKAMDASGNPNVGAPKKPGEEDAQDEKPNRYAEARARRDKAQGIKRDDKAA